jgi:hypothetical protein
MDPRRSLRASAEVYYRRGFPLQYRQPLPIAESTKPTGPDIGLDAATFASSDGAGTGAFGGALAFISTGYTDGPTYAGAPYLSIGDWIYWYTCTCACLLCYYCRLWLCRIY